MEKDRPPNDETTSETPSGGATNPSPEPSPDAEQRPAARVPVVALGASAGGLAALEEFFSHMPVDSGLAFVVVTHQRASQPSLLAELLAQKTAMPVVVVSEPTLLHPNHVYTAEPGCDLSVVNGILHPHRVDARHSLQMPIDLFLRSLARDQKERAVAIILSGAGSDGALGLKEIKAELGMVMVQEEASAQFGGMPHSAIATKLVDFVVPVSEMPARLLDYSKAIESRRAAPLVRVEPGGEALQQLLALILAWCGNDFSHYKPATVVRRVERRMAVHRVDGLPDYVRYVQQYPAELDLLFRELLIGVTSFFRDREAWEALESCVTSMLRERPDDYVVRAWVPACSTGEEAYSLAILLRECMANLGRSLDVQVFATDLDAEAIDVARVGAFPAGITNDVSVNRLGRFFVLEGNGYRVKKDIRDMLVFARQNLISDPPFTKLDILSCRNLLIYLDVTLQRRIFSTFHYALKPGGLLFLGSSESPPVNEDGSFTAVNKKWKIFRRTDAPLANLATEVPASPRKAFTMVSTGRDGLRSHGAPNYEQLAERMLLTDLVPPTVVVTEDGRVVYIHGRTGAFLEPAPGAQSEANVFNMARGGLQASLSAAIRQAAMSGEEIVYSGARVKTDGQEAIVNLRVLRLTHPEPLSGLFRVTFERPELRTGEVGISESSDGMERNELERELRYVREGHQAVVEELETANEELRASNEELQSTNEELQSTNEELGTSREELQSVNEELQTVNTELQSKMGQLAHANDDLRNLLNATEIATVFIDNDLRIKRYTERAVQVFRLIPTDVGRPISDLVSSLRYDALVDDSKEVLRTLVPREAEIAAADGCRYLMRILPYRTNDNVIEGLVLTFVNVTMMKTIQEEHARLLQSLDGSQVNVYGQDPSLVITWVSGSPFGRSPAELLGKSDRELFVSEDAAKLDAAKNAVLATGIARRERARMVGEQGLYDIHVKATRDPAGRISGIACVAVQVASA